MSAQRKKRSTGPSYHSQYRMRTCLASLAQAPCPDVRARALLGLAAAVYIQQGWPSRWLIGLGQQAGCLCGKAAAARRTACSTSALVAGCSRARVRVRVRVLSTGHAPPKTDAR